MPVTLLEDVISHSVPITDKYEIDFEQAAPSIASHPANCEFDFEQAVPSAVSYPGAVVTWHLSPLLWGNPPNLLPDCPRTPGVPVKEGQDVTGRRIKV